MARSITRKEKIHCRELNTGTHRTGIFQIDDKQIRADLYSYDGHFHVNVEQPLYLQTNENYIVSLHHNLSMSEGGGPYFSDRRK